MPASRRHRLPGALWELLLSGGNAVGDVPAGRWNADELAALEGEATSTRPRWVGGFLDGDVGAFDAEFFGISHEEAELMDPQHRMLLEVAWEACEHAGLPIAELAGSNTGVFAGMSNADHATYAPWLAGGGGPYHMTGNQFGTAAGRVSHALGLRGPSMAVDSACSSGLVAAHLACQSLQLGESDMALAGAVNLLLSPQRLRLLQRARRAVARRAAARPSTTRPTATCAPRAPSCSSSSASTTRSATATASSPCCAAPRSTTTAGRRGSPCRPVRRSRTYAAPRCGARASSPPRSA